MPLYFFLLVVKLLFIRLIQLFPPFFTIAICNGVHHGMIEVIRQIFMMMMLLLLLALHRSVWNYDQVIIIAIIIVITAVNDIVDVMAVTITVIIIRVIQSNVLVLWICRNWKKLKRFLSCRIIIIERVFMNGFLLLNNSRLIAVVTNILY